MVFSEDFLFLGFLENEEGWACHECSSAGVMTAHPEQRVPGARWSRDQPTSSMPWTLVLTLGLNMTKIT